MNGFGARPSRFSPGRASERARERERDILIDQVDFFSFEAEVWYVLDRGSYSTQV